MIIRFSVIAFVPPNAQLGVVGSAPFLGEWRVEHCVPLIPYSSPHPNGLEPSLWFRDIDISSLLPSSSSSSFHGESDPRHLHSANQQKASTDGGYTSTEEEEMRRTRRREDSCRKREDHEEGEKGGKREAGGYSSDEDLSSPSSSSSSERHRRSSSPCSSSPRRDCPFAVELLSVSRRLSSSCSSSTGNRGRGSKPRSHSSSGVCKTSHLPPPSAYNATNNSKTFSPYAHRDGRRQREGREEAEEDYSHGLPSRIPANSSSSSAGSSSSSNNVHPPGATCTTRRNGPCPNSTHSRGEEDYNKKRCGEEKSEGRKGGARERYMTSSSSSSLAGGGESPHSRRRRRKDRGERIQGRREGWEGVHRSVFYHIPTRDPKIQAILGKHPLKNFSFDYKFILWYPLESPPLPYCVTTMGDPDNISGVYTGAGGDDEDTDEDEEKERHWRKWLFPPIPARQPTPPKPGDHVIWEGYGPDSNRKFSFDPYDIVVDVNELGNLECLYISKIGHFRDPRAGGTGEYELTTRFYNTVKSECRMHYSTIFPGFYVGSCPRQLKHIRFLKEDLKVTCLLNLQTEQDICNNYPDPIASSRSAEAVSHLYEGSGLRYVWLPTTDMSDSARKIAVANAAFLLLGLFKSGHSVYIHCNAGVGRSVAAACAFLCFAVGLDLRKVNFLICAKRPVAYWDEKAMKFGVGDYQSKFGKCAIIGAEEEDKESEESDKDDEDDS